MELTPDRTGHRVPLDQIEIYYLSSADFYYQKLVRSKWVGTKDSSGRIVIKFTPVLQTSNIKIHCNYDDLDYLQQSVDRSEFYNSPEKLVTVYQKQYTRTESYGYDGMGNRLIENISLRKLYGYTYEYYPNSNRLKSKAKNDGSERYDYTYDANGNLIAKLVTKGEISENWGYSYDLLNQLVKVQKNGQVVASYIYDPNGFRVEKVGSKGKIDYVPLLNGEVGYRKEFSSGKEYSFIYVGGTHLVRVNGVIGGEGKKFFYHNDHEGSAMVVTDELGNKVVDRDFAPFGEKIKTSDREDPYPDVTEDGFTGKDFDEDIGLYYYNARWYDQDVGRFISEDSVADDPNEYGYCGENPVNNIDPTGHWNIPIVGGLQLFSATLNALAAVDPNAKEAAGAFGQFISVFNGIQNVQELFKKANRTETYEREIPAKHVGIPGVSYKEKVTITYKNHKVVGGETVQTFINEKGDLVEISTKASAKEFEQSYTVRTKDGTYEVTENIKYKDGEAGKKQTNVIAIEGFVKNKQGNAEYYGAIMVATTKQGAIGAWQGSTLSNDSSQYATIAQSPLNDPYTMTKVVHPSSYGNYDAIALEKDGPVRTTEPNPNPGTEKDPNPNYNLMQATGIHIHSGFSETSRGSHGCQTIFPGVGTTYPHGGNWNSFYDAVNRNHAKDGEFIGYYYLSRM